MTLKLTARTAMFGMALLASSAAFAQDNCPNRGDLDAQFCDANKDLVADTPTDPKKLKDPSTLVFAFTPVEDPSIYEKLFRPFMGHLSQCVGKKVVPSLPWPSMAALKTAASGSSYSRAICASTRSWRLAISP